MQWLRQRRPPGGSLLSRARQYCALGMSWLTLLIPVIALSFNWRPSYRRTMQVLLWPLASCDAS